MSDDQARAQGPTGAAAPYLTVKGGKAAVELYGWSIASRLKEAGHG